MIPLGTLGSARHAVASGWTPASMTGLEGWWDADDAATFTYSSGSVVSQWNDKSGLGRHMLQATTGKQPSRTGTINGRPAVLFTGLVGGMATAIGSTPSKPYTLLLCARNTAASGQREAFMTFDGGGADGRIFRTSGGTIDIFQGSFLSTGASWGTTAAHSVAAVLDGASSKIAADGATSWVTGNAGTQAMGNRFSVGCYQDTNGELWQGEICEAVAVAGTISDANRDAWFDYCTTKWGTP